MPKSAILMVRRRSSRQFLVAKSRCTKFKDAKYFIPDEICTAMCRRSDRLQGAKQETMKVMRVKLTAPFKLALCKAPVWLT